MITDISDAYWHLGWRRVPGNALLVSTIIGSGLSHDRLTGMQFVAAEKNSVSTAIDTLL